MKEIKNYSLNRAYVRTEWSNTRIDSGNALGKLYLNYAESGTTAISLVKCPR